MKCFLYCTVTILVLLMLSPALTIAQELNECSLLNSLTDVQKYERSIHIMAMLLVGFGFLMVFVKKYGRSALTATFLLVSIGIPVYIALVTWGIFGEKKPDIESLILAEFAAASLLITAGAVLGRLKMQQYLLLGILFIFCYKFNEWIVLDNGFCLLPRGGFTDTGGSIVIHAFGAIFGLGAAFSNTTKEAFEKSLETDATSDRYSMLGSMVLWIFWPSFCAALVTPDKVPFTILNVILALSGSTLATYLVSVQTRGKINLADIANASLAGGVAIGSSCDSANHFAAFIIGIIAGAISTFGFAVIQSKQQKLMRLIDTCGVTNLHGIPGIFGGLAVLPFINVMKLDVQLYGIGITILIAAITGLIAGKAVSLFGQVEQPYDDSVEFMEADN